jgi:hypothetical protein
VLLKKLNALWYNTRNSKITNADKTVEGTFITPEKNGWLVLLKKARESKQINVK